MKFPMKIHATKNTATMNLFRSPFAVSKKISDQFSLVKTQKTAIPAFAKLSKLFYGRPS